MFVCTYILICHNRFPVLFIQFGYGFHRNRLGSAADTHSLSSGPPHITALVAYSKGFACAVGRGTVHLYEKSDDKEFFKKVREIKVSIS